MDRIKIVADDKIPFLNGVFEPYAEIIYKDGRFITAEDVADADALMVRTRTKCNAKLLEGSSVKIIASATIGTDHIDMKWCDDNGILVCNAAGSNAGGVMQYVFSALYGTASRRSINLEGKTMGIIGVGNVGKRVEQLAHYLGFNVLKNDPPREAAEGSYGFCDLDTLLASADIVTLHVPLDDNTRGMADEQFFAKMQDGAFFINASRGEVVNEEALKKAVPRLGPVIIDTWCNEPHADKELIEMADIATPHIAGYSYQGKQNATAASVRAVARYFGFSDLFEFFPATDVNNEAVKLFMKDMKQGEITSVLQYNYPIFTDDFMFRIHPERFEEIRSNYQYRREIFFD